MSDTPPTPMLQPVTVLKGVGQAMAIKLEKLHLNTVQDVLFHLPLRYQDRTRISPIGGLQSGAEVLICGQVERAEVVYRKRRMLLVYLSDGTGQVLLRFFHFSLTQKDGFTKGATVYCFGEARGNKDIEMVHPEYRIEPNTSVQTALMQDTLTPIYPATDGVQQATLRKLVTQAMLQAKDLPELLPQGATPFKYSAFDALSLMHNPPNTVDVQALLEGEHPAQQRLAFEELMAHHLSMQRMRERMQSEPAYQIQHAGKLKQQFFKKLPFTLTGAQQRVLEDIERDLAKPYPSLRLVQGDVGSGKTVVANAALLDAVEAGYQAALMAPTELLAEQHYQNIKAWSEPLGVRVGWLSGRVKGAARIDALADISNGQSQIVVGTHALFQDEVSFKALAVMVIDEQHRFGVGQRLALRDKGKRAGKIPHQITMTATPIPRTLAMTAYADLDYSVIDELPPGRTPVTTVVLPDTRRGDVITRIEAACQEGRQVYWVCTLIEESEKLQCQAAEVTAEQLAEAMPNVRIGLVHGRMKGPEKQAVMKAFKDAELDLLVATTVIEVGVDVPNASLMVIENAERLGLSQQHQLRGRVGRGKTQSVCVLLYKPPLGKTSQKRLDVMRSTQDGFKIAEEDLHLRGPGEVLGTRQTGEVNFKVADVVRDAHLLDAVHKASTQLMEDEAQSNRVDALIQRWLGSVQKFTNV